MKIGAISKADGTTFEILAERVKNVHYATSSVAKGAVNQFLTIRNWAIGCYIVEYEQEGGDRAKYGARLLQKLADELSIKGTWNGGNFVEAIMDHLQEFLLEMGL